MTAGGCHCGAVRFTAEAVRSGVTACHCGQCRRWSGHVWASTVAPLDGFHLSSDAALVWFRSSQMARRGFCGGCGSSLFWQADGADHVAIAPGALDDDTGLSLVKHIFGADAGDYYAPEGPPPPVPPETAARQGPLEGACLCGDVAFRLPGPAGEIVACHCQQCRRLSGHYSASLDVEEATVDWLRSQALATYRTGGGGTRGFCASCGSSLWFRAADGAFSIEAGSVAAPTGGRLSGHIFVAEKGGYYEIDDGLPQVPGA